MISKFGKVMIYVKDPRAVADFWIDKIGFTEIKAETHEMGIVSVELAPKKWSKCRRSNYSKSLDNPADQASWKWDSDLCRLSIVLTLKSVFFVFTVKVGGI